MSGPRAKVLSSSDFKRFLAFHGGMNHLCSSTQQKLWLIKGRVVCTGLTRSNYHRWDAHSLVSTGTREVGLERGGSKPSVSIVKTNLRDKSDLPDAKT